MTTRSPRRRRFPGPQVWALAQDAYLAGESAASIAERLGLTVNGIRKRANRKGWTRTQAAEALERNRHPALALEALLDRIGPLIHAGRLEEASKLIASAEGLTKALRAAPPPPPREPDARAQAAWRAAETARLEQALAERMPALAEGWLRNEPPAMPEPWTWAAWRWRAQALGPETARADFARAVRQGWSSRYWDAEGRLKPSPYVPRPPEDMVRQHLWLTTGRAKAAVDAGELPWPEREPEGAPPASPGPRIRVL